MVPVGDRALSDEDKSSFPLQLEAQQPLLQKWDQLEQRVCGLRGVLVWACVSTFLLFLTSVTLVCFPVSGNLLAPACLLQTGQSMLRVCRLR